MREAQIVYELHYDSGCIAGVYPDSTVGSGFQARRSNLPLDTLYDLT